MIPPSDGFLTYVREITRKHRILLIADEVVTFRLDYGGGQEAYGFEADLNVGVKSALGSVFTAYISRKVKARLGRAGPGCDARSKM